MKYKILWMLLFCAFVHAVHAQATTYAYSGAPMTGTLGYGTANVYDYTILSGTVTLAAPLDPNTANQNVVPVSFSFNNDAKLSSQYVSSPSPAVFTFTTVNGVITAWTVTFDFTMDSTIENMSLTEAGDDYYFENDAPSCPPTEGTPCPNWTHWTATNSAQGVWSLNSVVMSAPPAPPAPACAAPPAATPAPTPAPAPVATPAPAADSAQAPAVVVDTPTVVSPTPVHVAAASSGGGALGWLGLFGLGIIALQKTRR